MNEMGFTFEKEVKYLFIIMINMYRMLFQNNYVKIWNSQLKIIQGMLPSYNVLENNQTQNIEQYKI